MEITIFDVEHGFCALAESPGYSMMFDCGSGPNFKPSVHLQEQGKVVDELIVSHPHEDHLSDFAALHERGLCRVVRWNASILPEQPFNLLKLLAPQAGANAFEAFRRLAWAAPGPGSRFTDAAVAMFCLPYPLATNENDLSVVTFLHTESFSIVLPGDLEVAGWRAHLRDPLFRWHLRRANIFIASHHGRRNGYCPEVFELCRPTLVLISDARKEFESQEACYGRHASGRYVGGELRRVLTTRRDGAIKLHSTAAGLIVSTESSRRAALSGLFAHFATRT